MWRRATVIQLGLLKVLIIYFAFPSLDTISTFKLQIKVKFFICNSQGPDEIFIIMMKRFFLMTTHSEI